MKQKVVLGIFIYVLICISLLTAQEGFRPPVLISPAGDGNITVVEDCTPTFSWTVLPWAVRYKIVIFQREFEKRWTYKEISAVETPVIEKEIPGQASAWTPGSTQRMSNGMSYIWFVQAIDSSGSGCWSGPGCYRIELQASVLNFKQRLKALLTERGIGSHTADEVIDELSPVAAESSDKISSDNEQNRGRLGVENHNYTYYGLGAGGTSTVSSNAFFGYNAGIDNTTGMSNTFIGHRSGYKNTTGQANTFVGRDSGRNCTEGGSNTFLGTAAGHSNATGNNNTFIGSFSGFKNTSGSRNVFNGTDSGCRNTIGAYNTFSGKSSGCSNTEGQNNNFFGHMAGYKNTTGNRNTFLGSSSGFLNETGSSNVFIGYKAGFDETGSNKLYIDNSTTSTPLIYGDFYEDIVAVNGKLGIGTHAPSANLHIESSESSPVFRISRSGGASFRLVAGSSNVQIGSETDHGIKYLAGGVWKMKLNPDGSLEMANGAGCSASGVWQNASSRALKENIVAISSESAFDTLNDLNPVQYNYKQERDETYAGFIAEDVPELVASKTRKNIGTMDLVAVLTKVTQEQQKEIKKQKKEILKQKKRFLEQNKMISTQDAAIQSLIKRIEKIEKE